MDGSMSQEEAVLTTMWSDVLSISQDILFDFPRGDRDHQQAPHTD